MNEKTCAHCGRSLAARARGRRDGARKAWRRGDAAPGVVVAWRPFLAGAESPRVLSRLFRVR